MNGKKLSIVILFACITCRYVYSDRLYYYGMDNQIPITVVSNKTALYNEGGTNENLKDFLSHYPLTVSWIHNDLCIIENIDSKILKQTFSDINSKVSSLPVYIIDEKIEAVLFPEIVIKSKNVNYDMSKIVGQYNMTLKKDGEIYQVYSLPAGSDPITIANEIYQTGNFYFAYPHFFMHAQSFSYIPNDPYFSYQITCHNTGQVFNDGHSGSYDADIDAPEAWEITKGSPDVVVAVFDEGVTSNHPDLPNSRQIRLNGSNFGYGNPNDPSPQNNENHGNACAGVIAASMDNNEGIAGIAPNCKIMPLRWDYNTDPTGMADGIKFAVDNGANIISCSWGYAADSPTLIPAIVLAIEYAIENNVVVVFAASNSAFHSANNDGYVSFPASANIDNLITVGASDRYDKIAEYSPSSSLIDVVAPSHRAYSHQIEGETFEMWSLDIPGDNGYNPAPYELTDNVINYGDLLPNFGLNHLSYTGRFGGTSHACPVVAGVVALMLSINPNLSPNEVFSILKNTSDKVGGYSYINGKSNDFGYGRVNAYAAVVEALPKIQGSDYICIDDTINFSLLDIPEDVVSYSWTTTTGLVFLGTLDIVQGQGSSSIRVVPKKRGMIPAYPRIGNIPSIDPVIDNNMYVSVTITMSDSTTYTIKKKLHGASGATPIIEESSTERPWCSGETRYFAITNNTDAPVDSLHWEIVDVVFKPTGNDTIITRGIGDGIYYTPYVQPTYLGTVKITATNTFETCGEEQSTTLTIGTYNPSLSLVATNDGNVLNISIVENNEEQLALLQLDERSSYILEIWHSIEGCVHTQSMLSNNEQINIIGFQQGTYILLLKENGNIIAQTKVIIN